MVLSFEDTPLSDWFAKNRVSLTLFIVVVFGGIYVLEQRPGWQADKQAESWALYQTVSGDVNLDENLREKLAQAEQDQLTYPWFVYTTTRLALQAKNTGALSILRSHLEKIAASEEGRAWWLKIMAKRDPSPTFCWTLSMVAGRTRSTLTTLRQTVTHT